MINAPNPTFRDSGYQSAPQTFSLQVGNISVYHGELQALRDVCLNIFEGQIVAIIGSNGAGKSTLLKAISGILAIRSGEVPFYGENISGFPPERIVKLGLSQVPERRRLFDVMSVMDNLLLGTYSWDRRRRKQEVEEALEAVIELFPVLKERRNQLARTLSGGEQQMLAIARGLMSRPKLLLLDEPSLGLAPLLVMDIMDVISRLSKEGKSILLVEQNARAALRIASYVYVLERGRVAIEGSPEELYENETVYSAYLG